MRKIVLAVDVEPDGRSFDPSEPPSWSGFDRTWAILSELREELATGGQTARFAWYLRLDPQIEKTWGSATWLVETYQGRLQAIATAGDEIGIHPHPYRWDETTHDWIADYGETDWPIVCLERSLDAYEECFGRPCPSHRYGDRFLSDGLVRTLWRRGVGIDLTVEPGRPELPGLLAHESSRGRIPDYRGVSSLPYRPSANDFRTAGGEDGLPIWILPLSMGRLPWPLSSASRLAKRLLGRGLEDPAVFTLSLGHRPLLFAWGLRQALRQEDRPLVIVLRAGDLGRPEIGRRVRRNVVRLRDVASRHPIRVTTPTDCLPPVDSPR